jgi:hypothetical protein
MAFSVACSEHSTPRSLASRQHAHGLRRCVLGALDAVRRVRAQLRASCARHVICCAAAAMRLRANPRTSCARVSPHGPRGAPGRSEGEARRVTPVVRAATRQSSSRSSRLPMIEVRVDRVRRPPRSSRLPMIEVRVDRVAKTAVAIVAFVRDREVRVLATPLGPAGRIRGDVMDDQQGRCDRARSRRAAARMAFSVACSEHSTPRSLASRQHAHGLRRCVLGALDAVRRVRAQLRASCARHVLCCAAAAMRLRANPRTSCARVSPHGPRGAPGRSEGEARRVTPVVRAATRQSSSRPSRLPMIEVCIDRVAKTAAAVLASAHDRGARRACGEDGCGGRRDCP